MNDDGHDRRRAVPRRPRRGLTTFEISDASLTVTFRRTWYEKFIAIVCGLAAADGISIGLGMGLLSPQTEMVCERGADVCSVKGHDVFGGAWSYSFPASAMTRSRVVEPSDGEQEWVVERTSLPRQELGAPTSRAAQRQQYATNSAALQAFIDDPAQRRFEARFESIGGPGGFAIALIGLIFAGVSALFVNGWRQRLVFDRATRELAIVRTPALIPPARRTYPRSSVGFAAQMKGHFILLANTIPTITFNLSGRHGWLFTRGVIASKKREAEFDDAARIINALLQRSGPFA